MNDRQIKRVNSMCELEKAVTQMMWQDVKNTPDDSKWRNYERQFTFEGNKYKVKCMFKVSNQYLTYKKLLISHDTQTIILPQGENLH